MTHCISQSALSQKRGQQVDSESPGYPKQGEIKSGPRVKAPGKNSWWRWHLRKASKHPQGGECGRSRWKDSPPCSKASSTAGPTLPGTVLEDPYKCKGPTEEALPLYSFLSLESESARRSSGSRRWEPLPSLAQTLCEKLPPAKGCGGQRGCRDCRFPTKFRRSGAELQWRDPSPAPARGRRCNASARAPRPGSLFPPPFFPRRRRRWRRRWRRWGGARARGGAGEEPRPRRPRGGRCGWGGGAAEAEVRGCPLRRRPPGAGARRPGRPPRRSFESGFDLRTTWGAQAPRPAPRGERRASPTAAPARTPAVRRRPTGVGGRPALEGGRRVWRPARKRGTRGSGAGARPLPS